MKILAAIARLLRAIGILAAFLVPFAHAATTYEVEPNDTAAQANLYIPGDTVIGQISRSNDQDWFAITATGAGTVTANLIGNANADGEQAWTLTIKDSANNVLASATCIAGAASPFPCNISPLVTGISSAGTYYVVVSSPEGTVANPYSLTISGPLAVPPPAGPACTLTASPGTITSGQASTLTANCTPAAASYVWTNTNFGTTQSSGTVSPTVTTTYSVTGVSDAGVSGNTASVLVTVTPAAPTCTLTATPSSIPYGGASNLTVSCTPAATLYAWSANAGLGPTASGGTVQPQTTTTYSVTGSNAAGVGMPASVTVTVGSEPPRCTLSASPSTVTGGSSSTLTVSCSPAATSYAWTGTGFSSTDTSGTVFPTSTTIYSVIGSNSAGPGNSASATVSVTPNCSLTASPSTIVSGSASTLTVSCAPAATFYTWTNTGFGASASTGSVSPTTTTSYSVVGSNAAGAGNSAAVTVTVNQPAPTCSLTASPSTITGGGSSTLTVTCSPAATSYAWTNTGFASTASSGTVFPASTTTYSVIGSNSAGPGNNATATVSVAPNCGLTASPSTIPAGGSSTLTVTCSPAATFYAWTNSGFGAATSTGSVSPTNTTTYSVVGSNTAGAGNSASATVTVTTAPNCTLTASPSTIIGGGTSTLTVSCSPAASSYAWSGTGFGSTTASGTVSPASTTTYSVVGSNIVGAGNSATATVSVTPNCTLSASSSSINAGGSVTLITSCSPAATSYAWTNSGFGLTVSAGTVTPTANTTYSVIGSNSAGSGNAASVTVEVSPCTYTLAPASQSVPLTITTDTVSVASASGCSWTTQSNVGWITLPFSTRGNGSGVVVYSVAANTNGGPRTGTLTVAGQTFTVTQQGMAVPNCTLTTSAGTINLGGSATLTASCSPAATSYYWAPTTGLVAGSANTAIVTPDAAGDYQYSVVGSNTGGPGNTASTAVTVAPASFISQSNCFFGWAEKVYPTLFALAGATSNTLAPYNFRFYPQTNTYLAISAADSHLYYLGPLSNNSIFDMGALSGWLVTAGCQ